MPCVSSILPDFSGKIIDEGRLQLLEVLGSGAYGVVYRAIDLTAPPGENIYAVKCLLKSDLESRQIRTGCREFDFHELVSDHPNILTIHKVIESTHYVYVVLDMCPEGDLFSAITEQHVYYNNVELVRGAFLQLIDAVHYCHQNGVFHRDLKPENVLCMDGGSHLLLADFGLATRSRVCKDFGCGSSYYMSPECIGREYDSAIFSTRHSDIWALGIILTNMITGRNPWRYATTRDECYSSFLHEPDFLRRMLPISEKAQQILKRIFKLNPLSRITLPELRKEISKIDTFFMTEEELANASDYVKIAAATYATRVPTSQIGAPRVMEDDSFDAHGRGRSEPSATLDPEEEIAYAVPDESVPISTSISEGNISIRLVTAAIDNFSIGSSSDSSSSEESDGPITPETHPVDPAIDVPDLDVAEGINEPAVYPPVTVSRPKKDILAAERHLHNAAHTLEAL